MKPPGPHRDTPDPLAISLPSGSRAIPHIGQASDELSDINSPTFFGSMCCLVRSNTNPRFLGLVTAGHVFTYGEFYDYGGVVGNNDRRSVLINGAPAGHLYLQQMGPDRDIAVALLLPPSDVLQNYISMSHGYYEIGEADLCPETPNLTLSSRGNNTRDGFALDCNVTRPIDYNKSSVRVSNIILAGSTNQPDTSHSLSVPGDSGGCVVHKTTGRLVGLILGGDDHFTFVLPIKKVLDEFDLKPF